MKVKRVTTTVSTRRQPQKPKVWSGQPTGPLQPSGEDGDRAAAADHEIHIHVAHLAAPQGSHRQGFGKSVKETNPRTEPYRHAVAQACEDWIEAWENVVGEDWEPMDGHLEVSITFWMMPPPKSDPDRPYPNVPPDIDKLVRSTFDGITRGRLWKDDARVVRLGFVEKVHAASAQETGVDILVRRFA